METFFKPKVSAQVFRVLRSKLQFADKKAMV